MCDSVPVFIQADPDISRRAHGLLRFRRPAQPLDYTPRSTLHAPCRLFRWDEIAARKSHRNGCRGNSSPARRETLAQIYLKRGAVVPQHAHDERADDLRAAGRAEAAGRRRRSDGARRRSAASSAGVPHQAEALDDTFVLGVIQSGSARFASANRGGDHDLDVFVVLGLVAAGGASGPSRMYNRLIGLKQPGD